MSAIYSTFKNCKKTIGSPCLFLPCVPVTLSVFSQLHVKCSKLKHCQKFLFYSEKYKIYLTKTLSLFLIFWALYFKLDNLKLPNVVKKERNGQFSQYLLLLCGSKCGNSSHSYPKNTTSTIHIFSP